MKNEGRLAKRKEHADWAVGVSTGGSMKIGELAQGIKVLGKDKAFVKACALQSGDGGIKA